MTITITITMTMTLTLTLTLTTHNQDDPAPICRRRTANTFFFFFFFFLFFSFFPSLREQRQNIPVVRFMTARRTTRLASLEVLNFLSVSQASSRQPYIRYLVQNSIALLLSACISDVPQSLVPAVKYHAASRQASLRILSLDTSPVTRHEPPPPRQHPSPTQPCPDSECQEFNRSSTAIWNESRRRSHCELISSLGAPPRSSRNHPTLRPKPPNVKAPRAFVTLGRIIIIIIIIIVQNHSFINASVALRLQGSRISPVTSHSLHTCRYFGRPKFYWSTCINLGRARINTSSSSQPASQPATLVDSHMYGLRMPIQQGATLSRPLVRERRHHPPSRGLRLLLVSGCFIFLSLSRSVVGG
ncbi:hypothetical protein IWZ03DRAFT_113341 [Phyllosticta citriasiana]|uniref:Uncharacterized protein n=1 Tax=Phyllosticta citriasiana TaxID=595635 RepID=A0ABR1KVN2_9PEZI